MDCGMGSDTVSGATGGDSIFEACGWTVLKMDKWNSRSSWNYWPIPVGWQSMPPPFQPRHYLRASFRTHGTESIHPVQVTITGNNLLLWSSFWYFSVTSELSLMDQIKLIGTRRQTSVFQRATSHPVNHPRALIRIWIVVFLYTSLGKYASRQPTVIDFRLTNAILLLAIAVSIYVSFSTLEDEGSKLLVFESITEIGIHWASGHYANLRVKPLNISQTNPLHSSETIWHSTLKPVERGTRSAIAG